MAIRRAKPVDQLYAAVRDHDLVLVPDPPLASAINRRLVEYDMNPHCNVAFVCLEEYNDLEHVHYLHLNDSNHQLGSTREENEHIGEGDFERILN